MNSKLSSDMYVFPLLFSSSRIISQKYSGAVYIFGEIYSSIGLEDSCQKNYQITVTTL